MKMFIALFRGINVGGKGVGRSKLAARAERLLGVTMTDRNWRTVCTIRDMVQQMKTDLLQSSA